MACEFGEQQRTVTADLERSRPPGRDLDSFTSFHKQVPRTERTRLVVSDLAEFDMDGHVREYLFSGGVQLIWVKLDLKQRGGNPYGLILGL